MELYGLNYLLNEHQRVFWVYLIASAAIALVYVRLRPAHRMRLFNREIWLGASARLDYGYFFVSAIIKTVLIAPLVFGAGEAALATVRVLATVFGHQTPLGWDRWVITAFYTISVFVVSDFTRYWLHRWLHTVPLLWRFHRVHHSAETLNPLTFYRVHPVENLLFGLRYAITAGFVTGVFVYLFASRLGVYEIFGANALVVLFSLAGVNLRHSHLPLGFGRAVERWLVSPRMHQFHHSPKGLRVNYGGALSLWDRLFKTLIITDRLPERYGLNEPSPHTSLFKLLFEPFYPNRKESLP